MCGQLRFGSTTLRLHSAGPTPLNLAYHRSIHLTYILVDSTDLKPRGLGHLCFEQKVAMSRKASLFERQGNRILRRQMVCPARIAVASVVSRTSRFFAGFCSREMNPYGLEFTHPLSNGSFKKKALRSRNRVGSGGPGRSVLGSAAESDGQSTWPCRFVRGAS